jgi:hypothetical protein
MFNILVMGAGVVGQATGKGFAKDQALEQMHSRFVILNTTDICAVFKDVWCVQPQNY